MNKNEISDEIAAVQKQLLILAKRTTEENWPTLVLKASSSLLGEARLQLRGDNAFLPIIESPGKRVEI